MSNLLFHREYLADLEAPIVAAFERWALEGPFPLRLLCGWRRPGIPPTRRLAELGLPLLDQDRRPWASLQLALFAAGRSKAPDERSTAHGRGAAVDAAPARVVQGYCAGIYLPIDGPEALERYERYGESMERAGLAWGGRWLKAFPPTKENPRGGDLGHVELPGWRELPFTP
mgnify:CR=1 FL=1